MFSCEFCNQVFTLKKNLLRHLQNVNHGLMDVGPTPSTSAVDVPGPIPSTSAADVVDVAATTSSSSKFKECGICAKMFPSISTLRAHLCAEHVSPVDGENDVEMIATCFKNRIAVYRVKGATRDDDIPSYLKKCGNVVFRLIMDSIGKFNSIKVQIELLAFFIKSDPDENGDDNLEGVLVSEKNFNSKFKVITPTTELDAVYNDMTRDILNQSEEFQERGSGWAFLAISNLLLNINKYEPLSGSSYIRLPEQIAKKHACINIKNYDDDACLAWCLTAALYPTDFTQDRISSYPHYSTVLNLNGIMFPVHLKDLVKIELMNNLSINVYELVVDNYGGCTVEGPIYFTKRRRDIHINLLYLFKNGIGHFVLIKNLSRLISSRLSNHEHANYICDGCLLRFPSVNKLQVHQLNDCNHKMTIIPSKDVKPTPNFFGQLTPQNILEFNNYKFTQMCPFVIYADFEALLLPIQHCEPNSTQSFTEKIEMHLPYSFAYYIVSTVDDSYNKFETYTGPDASQVFITKLLNDTKFIYSEYFKTVKPMLPLTTEEQHNFDIAQFCFICQNPFTIDQTKVRDHCHISGRYRGPAHTNCNLNYKLQHFVPVFFHNFSGYDCHLFIKEIAKLGDGLDVLPNNKERYISFSKRVLVDRVEKENNQFEDVFMKLKFLDSFRFMASSLDSLVSTLDNCDFKNVRKFFPHNNQFKLLTKKGIFPYNYMNSFDKLNDTVLPCKDAFFNKLTLEAITDEQYLHAQTVWETFMCQTLKDYSDLYLKSDVLLLADVFEKFRQVCFRTYGLDPANYYTAPNLSWDSMLKFTKIKLELLTDIDQVHFIKKGIRGGISQCSLRHARANNKFMEHFDTNLPSNFLMYWDANNLYGWAMSQPMPVGEFTWLNENQIRNFNFNDVSDCSDFGYILDVDVEYPKNLHDLHNDLPFLPENIIPPNGKCESDRRLIPNLLSKKNYIIHYRNLKQAVAHGLKVSSVNRVLSFKQSAWLKSYINKNTELRQMANNSFEKDFFKLMNNSVFGKTMENVDKRVDVKLVTSWDDVHTGGRGRPRLGARSLISKLNFKSIKIFTKTFSAIEMERLHVIYDKPLYIGFTVLELSKLLMYDFYYAYLKPKYGEDIRLCYMDTDSFTVQIYTDDIYNEVKLNLDKFDTSNYSPDNQFNIPLQNKAVLGLMKDENCGNIMLEFVGLRSKVYANRVSGERITKKSKGVRKAIVKRKITFENYLDCLSTKSVLFKKQLIFRSFNHDIFTVLQNKLVLSPYDSKRWIDSDYINTLAWGHHNIINNR
ncbi:uncharacterized protein [Onthophagus taurus]|uniref:uncharacterized protein n=1 Tax=Onthophagus taurus TaxID=166361 RepID=UPI0039BDC16C